MLLSKTWYQISVKHDIILQYSYSWLQHYSTTEPRLLLTEQNELQAAPLRVVGSYVYVRGASGLNACLLSTVHTMPKA